MSVEIRHILESTIKGGSPEDRRKSGAWTIKLTTAGGTDKTTLEISKPLKRGRMIVELTYMELDDLAESIGGHKERLRQNAGNDIEISVEEGINIVSTEDGGDFVPPAEGGPLYHIVSGVEDNEEGEVRRCPVCGSENVEWNNIDQNYTCKTCGTFNIESSDLIGKDDTPEREEHGSDQG